MELEEFKKAIVIKTVWQRLTFGCNAEARVAGMDLRGPGSRCPGSTTSTCWSRRPCWSPGSGLCSIPCWFPSWGWHVHRIRLHASAHHGGHCTTLKLYSDQHVTKSRSSLGKTHRLNLERDFIRCHKKLSQMSTQPTL